MLVIISQLSPWPLTILQFDFEILEKGVPMWKAWFINTMYFSDWLTEKYDLVHILGANETGQIKLGCYGTYDVK